MISESHIDEVYQNAISAIYHSGNRCDPFDHNIEINLSTKIAGQLGVMGRFLHFLENEGVLHQDQLRIIRMVGVKHGINDIFTLMSKANLDWYEILQQKSNREVMRMTGGDAEFYKRESERWDKWKEEAKKLDV